MIEEENVDDYIDRFSKIPERYIFLLKKCLSEGLTHEEGLEKGHIRRIYNFSVIQDMIEKEKILDKDVIYKYIEEDNLIKLVVDDEAMIKKEKKMTKKIPVELKDLLDLIFWSRRYCDGRRTYAPTEFNELYDKIVRLNCEVKNCDQFDHTLTKKGKFWPHAQDADHNENTNAYDARI